jgi:hypothetical protein
MMSFARKKPVNLWPKLLDRRSDLGGVCMLATGRMGSGKTSLLLHIARRLLEHKLELKAKPEPLAYSEKLILDEKLLWRGDTPAEWRKLPDRFERVVFVREGLDLKFYRNSELIDQPIVRFSTFEELVSKANPLALNVVYLRDAWDFMDLTTYVVNMPALRWTSLFYDEVEDIAAAYESGEKWHRVKMFSDAVKRSRKRRVSIYMATQGKSDIDHRVLRKIMYWAILPGARRVKDSRIWQRAIDKLKLGEYWLGTMGSFSKLAFPPYEPKDDMLVEGLDE